MIIQTLKKWEPWLWRLQGIFAVIALIGGLGIIALFMNVFFFPGNRLYTFHHLIAPILPHSLIFLLIIIGSFKRWIVSLMLCLYTCYFFIHGLILSWTYNQDKRVTFKYIDPLANISNTSHFLMILCGILLFILYSYYSWQRIKVLRLNCK